MTVETFRDGTEVLVLIDNNEHVLGYIKDRHDDGSMTVYIYSAACHVLCRPTTVMKEVTRSYVPGDGQELHANPEPAQ